QGEQCVVIDPGIDAQGPLDDVLTEHRLRPVAVLLTHGHVDHTFAVVPVCGARGIAAYVHPSDRRQLTDPWGGLAIPRGTPLFGRLDFAEPDDVRELADGEALNLAGLDLTVALAPGHTPGSVVFGLATPDEPVMFAGDLLFAGSIGRVDLPGGSEADMLASLSRVVLPLPDETVVHPGHGPSTTIGRERVSNSYLQMVAPRIPRTGL
ncbi:MAG: MBL fold metallo-hydrolase, partial [Actinomycetota bacterium]|nr:MBL fold metallo-hydrolase [Actinomycetota bacterium]